MGSHFQGSEAEVQALSAFINLVRATESILSRTSVTRSRGGLTVSQFGVLESLYHLGPLHQCELGTKLLKSSGNITLVVDNLEKRGLVQRVREGDDRRFVSVHLTAEGRALIERVFPEHAAQLVAEMSRLNPSELQQLRVLCRRLGQAPPDAPAGS